MNDAFDSAEPPGAHGRIAPKGALDEIRSALGASGILEGEALASLDGGWNAANLNAGVMICPAGAAEVAAVVGICVRHGVGIVPQGGRTGLVGGGVSHRGEIILSLHRMNRIERLDPIERVAVVEAGVTLEALQTAAAAHGLEPCIDLAARGSATLGGMASTNAGGVMAFRYGVMRHRVFGLEAVLADGRIYNDLTRVVKNAAGYDLKHLFIGAEGTLGIITRLAVKLDPLPHGTATALFGLPSVAAALEVVRIALDAEGGHLRAAEALWRPYLALTAAAHRWSEPAIPISQPIFLLLSLGGPQEAALRSAFESVFARTLELYPDANGIVASSGRQERDLWRLREDTGVIYRAYPDAPSFDVSVPLSEVEPYIERITRELTALGKGFAPFLFGHLADGNLHIVFNHAGPFDETTSIAVEAILYRDLVGLGGSFSAEHGVGSKRIHSLVATADETKLHAMGVVKRALDPKLILNPGKVMDMSARPR